MAHSIGRPGSNDVTGFERDCSGSKRNQRRNAKDEIRSIGILDYIRVHSHSNGKDMRIGHRVARGKPWSESSWWQ
jgi:hypothetical protein